MQTGAAQSSSSSSSTATAASTSSSTSTSTPTSTDWKKTSFIDRAKLRPAGDETDIEILRKSSKYIRRIILIRHGQSEGNVNKKMLTTVADHAIPLSEKGKEEMHECGRQLKTYFEKIYGTDPDLYPPIRLWTSPYKRCRQSSDIVFDHCCEYISDQREHILLGEQQFGLFEGVTAAEVAQLYPVESSHFKKLLDHHGRFWARPPLGESRFDVAKRVHQAFSTFQTDAKRHNIRDIVVVTHGITFRAFFMMWLHQTPEWFENEPNPGNGQIRLIEDDRDMGVLFAGFDDYAPGAGFTGPVGSVPVANQHSHHQPQELSRHNNGVTTADQKDTLQNSEAENVSVILGESNNSDTTNSADEADDESDLNPNEEESDSDNSQLASTESNSTSVLGSQSTAGLGSADPLGGAQDQQGKSQSLPVPVSPASLPDSPAADSSAIAASAHVHFALPNSPTTVTAPSGASSLEPTTNANSNTNTIPQPPQSHRAPSPQPTKPPSVHTSPTHPHAHLSHHPKSSSPQHTRFLNSSDAPLARFSNSRQALTNTHHHGIPISNSNSSNSSITNSSNSNPNPNYHHHHQQQQHQQQQHRSAMKGARHSKRSLARTLGNSDAFDSYSDDSDRNAPPGAPVIDLKQSIENLRFRN